MSSLMSSSQAIQVDALLMEDHLFHEEKSLTLFLVFSISINQLKTALAKSMYHGISAHEILRK